VSVMVRHRVSRAPSSLIEELRVRVLSSLRVIVDGEVLVSPSLTDSELECFLKEILKSNHLCISDIQKVFSGLASTERIKRVLSDLVRRGDVRVCKGVYYSRV